MKKEKRDMKIGNQDRRKMTAYERRGKENTRRRRNREEETLKRCGEKAEFLIPKQEQVIPKLFVSCSSRPCGEFR